ncbi:MAG: peptidoglycan-binding protein [Thiothrix sp.]|nr:MAG: peptidoglycan-binding protein [Thiothrix sp.]
MQNTITLFFGLLLSFGLTGCLYSGNQFNASDHTHTTKPIPRQLAVSQRLPTQCSAELLSPARFQEESIKVLVYSGAASYSNIPAEMVWSETKIQVEPARYAQETEPAQYEEFEDIIEVERARSELYATPAQYQKVAREIVLKPQHKRWKQGCLAGSQAACLDTIEAELVKIPTEIIKEPAQIHQRSIPAKTIKIKRKQLLKSGKGIGPIIPARYETIKLLRISKPWKIISSLVPAQYKTILVQRKLKDERLLNMPVACAEHLSLEQIKQIQLALIQTGQNITSTGNLDAATIDALHAFQEANNLAIGGLSLETLRKLGLA